MGKTDDGILHSNRNRPASGNPAQMPETRIDDGGRGGVVRGLPDDDPGCVGDNLNPVGGDVSCSIDDFEDIITVTERRERLLKTKFRRSEFGRGAAISSTQAIKPERLDARGIIFRSQGEVRVRRDNDISRQADSAEIRKHTDVFRVFQRDLGRIAIENEACCRFTTGFLIRIDCPDF
ncbi:MAG: hypothetical protein WC969_13605 [Elusimicrobiota bacterium]